MMFRQATSSLFLSMLLVYCFKDLLHRFCLTSGLLHMSCCNLLINYLLNTQYHITGINYSRF